MYKCYLHCVLIRGVVSSVDNSDSLAPIQTEGSAEDVDGGPTLVPLDRGFGLQGAVRGARFEARVLDQPLCLFDHLRPALARCLAVVEGQQRTFVLHPGAVFAEL